MIRSMTGFGAGTASEGRISVRAEVRSVNHRHLQVKVRASSEHAALEGEVEARVREKIERGSVSVSVEFSRPADAARATIDVEAARRYRDELVRVARALEIEPDIELDDLLHLPGVVVSADERGAAELEVKLARRALDAALGELIAMREREGAALERELRKHAVEIGKIAKKLRARAPKAVKEAARAFEDRVAELLERSTLAKGAREALDSAALAREVALIADKMDVSEEFARLESHLGQLSKLFSSAQPVGRQLDFLAQEFFREANTIGSKANDAAGAHLVVELKTWIERLREQVQNVE